MPVICDNWKQSIYPNFIVWRTWSFSRQQGIVRCGLTIVMDDELFAIDLGPDFHKIAGSDLDGDQYFVSHPTVSRSSSNRSRPPLSGLLGKWNSFQRDDWTASLRAPTSTSRYRTHHGPTDHRLLLFHVRSHSLRRNLQSPRGGGWSEQREQSATNVSATSHWNGQYVFCRQ